MPSEILPCQLCGEPNPIASRNFGLDLCEPCTAGYLGGRLGRLGAQIVVEERTTTDRNGDELLVLHVVALMPTALPLMARFRPRTWITRFQRMFERDRFACGDPLFDGTIEVDTRSPELLRTLLANDGFQSAVMALTTATGGFRMQPGVIEVRAALDDLDLRAEVPLAVAALLRHLASAA